MSRSDRPHRLAGLPYRIAYWLWLRAPDLLTRRLRSSSSFQRVKNRVRDVLAKGGTRDDIYSRTYYERVDSLAGRSSGPIVDMIFDQFHPSSAVDVGCGTGAILLELRRRGIDVLGLERSTAAIEICRSRDLEVNEFDIESAVDVSDIGRFDVAICTEVAEHVKAEFADRLVDHLTALSDQVVFTAAVPGQGGGVDHVNEQPRSYWINRFREREYEYLHGPTEARQQQLLNAGVVRFYADNLMLFERARATEDPAASRAQDPR